MGVVYCEPSSGRARNASINRSISRSSPSKVAMRWAMAVPTSRLAMRCSRVLSRSAVGSLSAGEVAGRACCPESGGMVPTRGDVRREVAAAGMLPWGSRAAGAWPCVGGGSTPFLARVGTSPFLAVEESFVFSPALLRGAPLGPMSVPGTLAGEGTPLVLGGRALLAPVSCAFAGPGTSGGTVASPGVEVPAWRMVAASIFGFSSTEPTARGFRALRDR